MITIDPTSASTARIRRRSRGAIWRSCRSSSSRSTCTTRSGRACSRRSAGCRGTGSRARRARCSRRMRRRSSTALGGDEAHDRRARVRQRREAGRCLPRRCRRAGGSARVHLIDVSSQALEQTEQRLTGSQHVSVVGHQSTYEVGLRRAAAARDGRRPDARAAARVEHRQLRRAGGARFPAPHPPARCGPAICCCSAPTSSSRSANCSSRTTIRSGVTAAFNKNLLVRINHELGGNFDLARVRSPRRWNADEQRIEMHLVSRIAQTVHDRRPRMRRSHFEPRRAHLDGELVQVRAGPDRAAWRVETGFAMRDQWIDTQARASRCRLLVTVRSEATQPSAVSA